MATTSAPHVRPKEAFDAFFIGQIDSIINGLKDLSDDKSADYFAYKTEELISFAVQGNIIGYVGNEIVDILHRAAVHLKTFIGKPIYFTPPVNRSGVVGRPSYMISSVFRIWANCQRYINNFRYQCQDHRETNKRI